MAYIAGFAPDPGENINDWKSRFAPAPGSAHLRPDDQGHVWMECAALPEVLGGDGVDARTNFLAAIKFSAI